MKRKLFYIFVSIASLIAFQGCLMEEPDDIYKFEEDGGGPSSGVDFSANITNIEPGGIVQFTNNSANRFVYFYWEFGDGYESNYENPTHNYYEEGIYDVTLYAMTENGEEQDLETKYGYITVAYGSGSNNYCESYGGTSYEWIENVNFDESFINYTGNDGGYGDYTNENIFLNPNSYIYIELTPGFSSTAYTEYFRVWIDYNKDGDFNDDSELIAQGSGTSVISGEIYIGDGTGSTRMRISMSDSQYREPCETFSYGEVEDYTVIFNSKKKNSNSNEKPTTSSILRPINGDYTVKLK